jgi:hypothetical protein
VHIWPIFRCKTFSRNQDAEMAEFNLTNFVTELITSQLAENYLVDYLQNYLINLDDHNLWSIRH